MKSTQIFVSFMARKSTLEEAQAAVLQLGALEHTHALTKNPNLANSVWWKIAKVKDNLGLTSDLVTASRDLDDPQIHFILKDKRGAIRSDLFTNCLGSISKSYGDYLVRSGMVNERLATHWLQGASKVLGTPGKNIPEYMLRAVAHIENAELQLHHLKNKNIYTAPDAVHILANLKRDSHITESDLAALFDLRSELVHPAAVKLSKQPNLFIALGLATCRHIFDQGLFQKALEVASASLASGEQVAKSKELIESLIANPNVGDAVALAAIEQIHLATTNNHYRYAKARSAVGTYQQALEAGLTRKVVTQDWLLLPQEEQLTLAANLPDAAFRSYPTLAAWFPTSPPLAKKTSSRIVTLEQVDPSSILDLESLTSAQLQAGIQEPLTRFGTTGFSTLLHLSIDWHGSLADLIQTTIATCA